MKVRISEEITFDLQRPEIKADGFRIWIGGESGSGKSHAAALVACQVLEQNVQLVVLDSHGEYPALAALTMNAILIGYDTPDAIPLELDLVDEYLDHVRAGRSVFINLLEWTDIHPDKLNAFIVPFLRGLYELCRKKPRRLFLLVEEAQNFAPQSKYEGDQNKVRLFVGVATGGRKYGISVIVCSQRQALVDKSVLASCNVRVFLRTSEVRDWKVIAEYLPDDLGITYDKKDGTGIRYFKSGEAVVLSRWVEDRRVMLKRPTVAPAQGVPAILL